MVPSGDTPATDALSETKINNMKRLLVAVAVAVDALLPALGLALFSLLLTRSLCAWCTHA